MVGLGLRGLLPPKGFCDSINAPLRNPLRAAAGLSVNPAQVNTKPKLSK